MDRVILRGMRACLICMPYMYVARDRCMPYLYFLYDCLICDRVVFRGMSGVSMYALYDRLICDREVLMSGMHALYACLI